MNPMNTNIKLRTKVNWLHNGGSKYVARARRKYTHIYLILSSDSKQQPNFQCVNSWLRHILTFLQEKLQVLSIYMSSYNTDVIYALCRWMEIKFSQANKQLRNSPYFVHVVAVDSDKLRSTRISTIVVVISLCNTVTLTLLNEPKLIKMQVQQKYPLGSKKQLASRNMIGNGDL